MKLEIRNLHYGYGERTVLGDVSLTVMPGEIVALIGPNGVGKSTLIKCASRILKPRAGHILIGDTPLAKFDRRSLARLISYVPQQAGPAMAMPVFEMVALGRAPYRGLNPVETERRIVREIIEEAGLFDLAFRSFAELSGGERQRVLIARALAQAGKLMLLDEPTNNLDLRHQMETMTMISSVSRKQGLAVLVAIHDLSLAARFADRLILLRDGQVHLTGPWREVLTSENLKAVYGIGAVTGTDSVKGWPYILPD